MTTIGVRWRGLAARQIQARQRREIERLCTDEGYALDRSRHAAYACIGDWLEPSAGRRALELGCGPGRFVALLATLGYHVVGVDPHRFDDWDVIQRHHNVELRAGVVAESLPLADASFDCATCLGALLYFDDVDRSLRELVRVLRPGARVVVRSPNRDNLYTRRTGRRLDPSSRQLHTLAELVIVLERAGLRVDRTFSYGFWPPFASAFYWYLTSVWMPLSAQDKLSRLTPLRSRVNNVVFATIAE